MNILLEKNKPLLLYGHPGCGKTYIALELLKDTILLRLDSINLKDIKNIKKYILDKIEKRNITLMFKKVNECRGLLIDDINVFHKYDKNSFNAIIDFIKDKKYYDNKIIITSNISFIKNKYLVRCKLKSYHIKYSYHDYYKICLKISENKKFNLNLDELDNKIYNSKYNFHIFISDNKINIMSIRDNYDGIEEHTNKLFNQKYNINNIFRICYGDEKIILLNMIENIKNSCDKNKIYFVYNFVDLFNKKDIFYKEYYLLNIPIYMINGNIKYNNKEIIYNKYIIHGMISNKNNINYDDYLYYLIDTYIKYNKYYNIINNYDNKLVLYHKQIYENLNNIKVKFP